MNSEDLNDFLKDPRHTMLVRGRLVLTVDGAHHLLASLPRPILGDVIADFCESKIAKAEEIKRNIMRPDGGRNFDTAVDKIIEYVDRRLNLP